ncbi:redoxin domain-containing protein [Rufibacter sediminis]|uniref:AhpC/TSA family protein n=1 Tax=Rufibacter sediminis TaxID=2762756 RepID=A0ABR6VS88_9BACT|nr:TlpA disulfide reductase family protein [Rufibacter sediminis]MBC3540027.1 AhpC/TSA family protein [Rufibacter sediminis]
MLQYLSVLLLFYYNQLIVQNSFAIKGSFKDYDGVIYLNYNNMTDSAFVRNGIFAFTGDIDLPIPASLITKDSRQVYYNEFVLEPGELNVQVDTTTKNFNGKLIYSVNSTVLGGGKTNALLDSFYNSFAANRSSLEHKSITDKKQKYIQALRGFVSQYPKEMASMILIEQASPGFSQQELISFYEAFDVKAKNSYYGVRLKKIIDKNNKAVVKTPIKDFAQTDLHGKLISISSLRGKWVLVNFWASWCLPCRQENPNLIRIYQKYKSKGFEVLGVSLDANQKNWLKAVEQDKLTWLNVSDLRGSQNEVALLFNVEVIPDNILIDREGRIIAKKISSEELEQLLNNVF